VRIESSVIAISWIPSEAVEGLAKMPFSFGVAHYDDAPPDQLVDIDLMHRADLFREANELRAWIEVDDGKIVDHGHNGRGRIGVTRLKVGPKKMVVPAVAMPTLQGVDAGDGWVRFTQTAGGRTGAPAPRTVRGRPYFQWHSAIAWTTLSLTLRADGSSEWELVGASSFPRHWVYDREGKLVAKSGVVDFDKWYREAHVANTPWGSEDSPAVITAAESEFERELSAQLMDAHPAKPIELAEGHVLFRENDPVHAEGAEVYLVLDGILDAEVGGEQIGEVGPGAIVGERGVLEGRRTATLTARTKGKVVPFAAGAVDTDSLAAVGAVHHREDEGSTA
jgi:mannose-6-phosphate isomerase-like protein (cupin superfamily)